MNVRIRFDTSFGVEYAFEPFSQSQADGQLQRKAIGVSPGSRVAAGDPPRRLISRGSAAHVHFTVLQNGVGVCPEPYFTLAARDSVMALIHRDGPTWRMCY